MAKSDIQHQLITAAINKGMSYPDYREKVKETVRSGPASGENGDDSLLHYTRLNDKRMDRLDKTLSLPPEAVKKVKAFDKEVTWLILTEGWCGDAAQTLPVIRKIAELNPHITMKLVWRDENLALMDLFLTRGTRSIPKLIMVDNNTKEVLHTWGPRPYVAMEKVNAFKEKHGKLTPEFKEELQRWYNKDKGKTTVKDLLELLS